MKTRKPKNSFFLVKKFVRQVHVGATLHWHGLSMKGSDAWVRVFEAFFFCEGRARGFG